MSVRRLVLVFASFLLIALIASSFGNVENDRGFRCEGCNIIVFSFDTLRADHMGVYGYQRNTTPNIDRLANRSVVFERMFAQSFHTTPSTFSTFSSVYPTEDVFYEGTEKSRVENFTMLAEILQEEGYSTYSFNDGSNIRAELGFDQGFDHYREGGSRMDRSDKIESLMDLEENERFFMYYQSFQTHYPNYVSPYPKSKTFNGTVPEFGNESLQNDEMGEVTEKDIRNYFEKIKGNETLKNHAIAEYDSSISLVDNEVEDILSILERKDLMDNTVIIITSQHGENLGEHGKWRHEALWNEVMRVPYIMYVPGGEEKRIENYTEMVDVAPTILDIVGAEDEDFDEQAEGDSLLPLLNGKGYSSDFVLSIYQNHVAFIETSTGLKYYRRPEETLLFNLTEDFEEENPIENRSEKKRMENLFQDVYNQVSGREYEGGGETYPYFVGS